MKDEKKVQIGEVSDVLYMNNQQVLRSRLIRVLKYDIRTIMKTSEEIGIARNTLFTFINGKDTTWSVLNKIEFYIIKQEKKLGLK
jgi:predicted transcriptional regulator